MQSDNAVGFQKNKYTDSGELSGCHRNQDIAILLPILQQYFFLETTRISNLWGAHDTVSNIGYQHLTIKHQLHLVDPVIYATMNHVESIWSRAKQKTNLKVELIACFCQPI